MKKLEKENQEKEPLHIVMQLKKPAVSTLISPIMLWDCVGENALGKKIYIRRNATSEYQYLTWKQIQGYKDDYTILFQFP